jgi:hypothetical protein
MGSGIEFWLISMFNNRPYIKNVKVINHAFLLI